MTARFGRVSSRLLRASPSGWEDAGGYEGLRATFSLIALADFEMVAFLSALPQAFTDGSGGIPARRGCARRNTNFTRRRVWPANGARAPMNNWGIAQVLTVQMLTDPQFLSLLDVGVYELL